MKQLFNLLFAGCFAAIWLTACSGSEQKSSQEPSQIVDTNSAAAREAEALYERAKAMFYAMPSPLELQSLIETAGGYFRGDLLHDPQQSSAYQSTKQQALALGVYGTDLSYATVFEQQQEALLHMAAAQRVAKKIGVEDPFGGGLMDRAHKNMASKDSMLSIVSELYWEMNSQLKENDRHQLALVVLAAGWIEGIYLGTQMMDEKAPNTAIAKTIAEQRFIANQLHQTFTEFAADESITEVYPIFKPVLDKYLSIPLDKQPAKVSEKNGKTVIGGGTAVKFTDADLLDIKNLVAEARNQMIAL